jgi:hypothetical protein
VSPLIDPYFYYSQSGHASMPGANTNGINEAPSANGGPQYTVKVYDLSGFPNNLR